MKTAQMKSPAGKRMQIHQLVVFHLFTISIIASVSSAQQPPVPHIRASAAQTPPVAPISSPGVATPPPAYTPLSAASNQSSLTVQQIVARQEDHFARIKNAQGIVVHSEVRFNAQRQELPALNQYIFFAYEGSRSVTLTMPEKAAQVYKGSQGQIPWGDITSACHVTGDTVYTIRKPEGNEKVPSVVATAFNPAIHENNPLVSFHPRQISDEQMPLRDLARAIPEMAQRPMVSDITKDGKPMIRIDFTNPKTPAEQLYYIIDPARGYLPVEIARLSSARPISLSSIIIGNTPDGTWIPARRERLMYDKAGKLVSRQNWHYEYLAVNQGLAPKTLTLMYFNLPLDTKVEVVGAKSGLKNGATPASTAHPLQPQSNTPTAIKQTPVPTPLQRAISTPMRVPL